MTSSSLVAPTASAGRIGQIDTLRAFAMTAVIAQHSRILPFGWLGVWLFFVISGFVVTESLVARKVTTGIRDQLLQFYIRRIVRIWPIYLAFVGVGFFVSSMVIGRFDWRPMLSLALFYNNVEVAFGHGFFAAWPAGQLWTISVEWQFYLIYGLSFVIVPRSWLVAGLMALVLVCPLGRLAAGLILETRYSAADTAFAIYTFPGLHFDAFAMGCLLALFGPRIGWRLAANRLTMAGCVALTIYCAAFVAINAGHGARGVSLVTNIVSGIIFKDRREVFVYSAIDVASVALVAIAVAGGGMLDPLLKPRWLQAVGRVSYGGYVYHSAVLSFTLWAMNMLGFHPGGPLGGFEQGMVEFAFGWPITVAAAFASYRWIEQPLTARVSGWLRRRSAVVT